MKIGQKLTIAFTLVALVVGIVGMRTLLELRRIHEPMHEVIPGMLDEISRTTELGTLIHFMRYYDEVLTHSARNYAFTSNEQWKNRYYNVESLLEEIIQKAEDTESGSEKIFLQEIGKAQSIRSDIEKRAIGLIDQGQSDEAMGLLDGREYWRQKNIYNRQLDKYLSRRGGHSGEVIARSKALVNRLLREAHAATAKSEQLIISLTLFTLVVAMVVGYIVSRTISAPIRSLVGVARELSKGNLEYPIEVKAGGEIGELSARLKEMVANIKHDRDMIVSAKKDLEGFSRGLEEKVRERTQEVADTQAATLNILEDLQDAYEDLKNAQDRLVQTEKMASMGVLAAGVAHEINNPATYTLNNLTVLAEYAHRFESFFKTSQEFKEQLPHEAAQGLDELKENLKIPHILSDLPKLVAESLGGVERIKLIVQDLKVFARPDEEEPREIDLNECMESSLNICWNELKYKAEVFKEYGTVPKVICHPQQVSQVFINLLINAVQAIKEKGAITIKTYQEENSVCISISDTGIGIPEDALPKIFDPFYTTKGVGKGTGLGLSIIHGIVEKHGGKITVSSKLDEGTTFAVHLPIPPGRGEA